MRHAAPVLTAVSLVLAGCASPQLILVGRGDLHLVRVDESISIGEGDPLVIEWQSQGTRYSTASMARKSRDPVRVRLVEASERFVRVRSESWKEMDDIPSYFAHARGGIRITARSGRYRHPTAAIPVDSITAIGVHELLPRLARTGPRDVLVGIGGGAMATMVGFATYHTTSPPLLNDYDEGEDILLGTVVIGATGGLLYPAWRMFRPRYGEEPVTYSLRDPAEYCLEIR